MRKSLIVGALALTGGTGMAQAQDLGAYVGVGAIQSEAGSVSEAGINIRNDFRNDNYKVFVGIHPSLSPIGVEVEYLDFGSDREGYPGGFVETSGNSLAFDAVGYLPLHLPFVSVYGKAGVSRYQVDSRAIDQEFGELYHDSDHSSQFTYGAGVQVHFAGLGARFEYEHFNIVQTDGVDVYTIGFFYTFL